MSTWLRLAILAALLPLPTWAATPSDLCEAAKLIQVGRAAGCRLAAHAKASRGGTTPDTAPCAARLLAGITQAERRFGSTCPVPGDGPSLDALVRARTDAVAARLAPTALTGRAAICAASKLAAAGSFAACLAKQEARALQSDIPAVTTRCREKVAAIFARSDTAYGAACPTAADADVTTAEISGVTAAIRLNVVVIYLDDTRADAFAHLPDGMVPHLERLADEGVVFTNAFAPTPICAQSRASLLTGLRIAGGVRGGHGVGTGTKAKDLHDDDTLATWFAAEGRHAGLFGKYINGYDAALFDAGGGKLYVPPGWTDWLAVRSPEHYGGLWGATWWAVGHDGSQTEQRGCCNASPNGASCYVLDAACIDDQTYQTDVLGSAVTSYVQSELAAGWLGIMTPSASHTGYGVVPNAAARHAGTLAGLPAWRPTSFALPIVNAAPHPGFDAMPLPVFPQPGLTDYIRQGALETLLAVDEAVGELLDTLEGANMLERTAIVLASDNGSTWGEHGLWNQSKACAYEECQRIPLIVRMPGGAGRTVDEPVLVTDLAPTVAALARVPMPNASDGRSFEPLLRNAPPAAPWRTDYCLEYDSHAGSQVSYRGVRDVAGGFTYVLYSNGSVELFDLGIDPGQLVNVAGQPAYAADEARLAARLVDLCA